MILINGFMQARLQRITKWFGKYSYTLLIPCLFLVSCDQKKEADFTESDIHAFLTERYFEVSESKQFFDDFEYQLLNGKTEKLSDNANSVILLNFWATWCAPCKHEMPDLETLKHLMKNMPFRILAVNSGEKPGKIQRFIKRFPYTFDIVLDENRTLTRSLNITGLPTTFILNGKREVLGKIIGPTDWKNPTFVEFLKTVGQIN